jgi:transcriptional regulator with XRE-family HTH domain
MSSLRLQFGRRLALLRRQSGFSQTELAFETGLSRDQISLMETGKSGASFDSMEALAEALSVEVWELLYFRDLA